MMDRSGGKKVGKEKLHKILFAIGMIGVIILNIASWKSVPFSDWYIKHIFPIWLNTYARLTSMVPISVGEIMLVLAVAITLFGICLCVYNLICKRKFKKAVRKFGIFYAWTVLIVCYVMTLNCFILYHGSSFSEKYMAHAAEPDTLVASTSGNVIVQTTTYSQNKEQSKAYTKKDLAALRDYIVAQCNTLADEVDHDDSGAVYYDGDLIEASRQAMKKLGEDYDQLSGFM